ncbi:unnamed protein product [Mycolicibacterium fortuitum subsp. acetamidolyticum]|uniref:Uncharacterized protein n=1 Tax=Mycolicibacterium fortuitum subsp. acetamidolyticum TaxID=144550 RepID=A0A100WT38_MYCFO|nr:unnamed protein product [Mycolicibacterium fortuitum subsp. acetamidolyticum]
MFVVVDPEDESGDNGCGVKAQFSHDLSSLDWPAVLGGCNLLKAFCFDCMFVGPLQLARVY